MAETESSRNRWLFMAPRECFTDLEDETGKWGLKMLTLRHPFFDEGVKFLYDERRSRFYEISAQKDKYGSWFVDGDVKQDGSFFLSNQFDPLFLLLPYLRNSGRDGKFMLLDQIVKDEKYPDCAVLADHADQVQLSNIADISGSGDFVGFKYSREKTLLWLTKKTKLVREAIKKSAMFIAAGDEEDKENEDIHLEYAFGIVSNYLSEDVANLLQMHLNIKKRAEKRNLMGSGNPSSAKKMKNSKGDAEKSKKRPKMSKAQRELSKVDKKGMKSISSFFAPARKKKAVE